MKKLFISIAVVAGAAGLIYVLTYKPTGTATTNAPTTTQPDGSSSTSSVSTGIYKDGTYKSNTIAIDYGPVQVSVQVSGGNISTINMLQAPYDHPHSKELADYATPILIREAISAQSANVDSVSGATETSQGFIDALQSALDQAKS